MSGQQERISSLECSECDFHCKNVTADDAHLTGSFSLEKDVKRVLHMDSIPLTTHSLAIEDCPVRIKIENKKGRGIINRTIFQLNKGNIIDNALDSLDKPIEVDGIGVFRAMVKIGI